MRLRTTSVNSGNGYIKAHIAVYDTAGESTDRHEKVRLLHATFHQEVSKVLSLALAGSCAAALKAMDDGSPYAGRSASLTLEMMSWPNTEVA